MKLFQNILKSIIFILIICLLILPFIVFIFWLKANNKTVTFKPEFKIKDIENNDDVDPTLLKDALDKLKDTVFQTS